HCCSIAGNQAAISTSLDSVREYGRPSAQHCCDRPRLWFAQLSRLISEGFRGHGLARSTAHGVTTRPAMRLRFPPVSARCELRGNVREMAFDDWSLAHACRQAEEEHPPPP